MESPIALPSYFICYLCGDLQKRPRILPCGHTFCSECLAKVRDEILQNKTQSIPRTQQDEPDDTITIRKNGSTNHHAPEIHESPNSSNESAYNYDYDIRRPSSSCVDGMDGCMVRTNSFPPSSSVSQSITERRGLSPSTTMCCFNTIDKNDSSKRISRVPNMPNRKSSTIIHGVNNGSSINGNANGSMTMIHTYNANNALLRTNASIERCCSKCGSVVQRKQSHSSSPVNRKSANMSLRHTSSPPSPNISNSGDRSAQMIPNPRWDTSSPLPHPPACAFELRHGRELEPFVCPIPECNYSMRVMNLARWSTKNKALADAIAAWKCQQINKKDASCQTDISRDQSVLVTIPRGFVDVSTSALVPLSHRKRHSSMIDIAFDQDNPLQQRPAYIPRALATWKSYAALVGMNILQQIVNL